MGVKTKEVTFRLTEEAMDALRQQIATSGKSRSMFLRDLVNRWLRRRGWWVDDPLADKR